MRKMICTLLCLILALSMTVTCAATERPCVVDDAHLLSAQEEELLTEKVESLRQKYEMDVVILTVDSLGGQSAMVYAEDYYDYNGYGIDDQRSGTLFLLAMDEREWYIDTSGDAIYALTDYALLELEEMILPYLRDGDYYGAFEVWLDGLDSYFRAYADGEPVDGIVPEEDRYYGHEETVYGYDTEHGHTSVNWLISVAVGLAAAGIVLVFMRSAMNTKRRENSAHAYMKPGSYDLKVHKDVFLYSQVSKTRKESSSSSGSSRGRSGGGSSVHRSSSGRSHGGRGGKF